jgi:hypothetical protein
VKDEVGLVLVIALAILVSALGKDYLETREQRAREVVLEGRPVYIPCPVPVWDTPPRDLDDMAERAELARKMMEECGAMREEAKRSK